MSAEVLRRAASLMRERAEAAIEGPWEVPESIHGDPFITQKGRGFLRGGLVGRASGEDYGRGNSEHIASWDPVVALAVADLLDVLAAFTVEGDDPNEDGLRQCLAVARAYLGESE